MLPTLKDNDMKDTLYRLGRVLVVIILLCTSPIGIFIFLGLFIFTGESHLDDILEWIFINDDE